MVENLSWVPAQDLVRFEIVCKQWRSLIKDPSFIDLHKSRAGRRVMGTAKYPNRRWRRCFSLEQKTPIGQIIGSNTCGWVCAETGDNIYHIRNPSTGKSFQLPPLKSNSYAIPQSRQYNVVAVCKYYSATRYNTFYWALFTIGVD